MTGTTTADSSTTEPDSSGTTGEAGFGQCGWDPMSNYYACAADGGVPGAGDPKMEEPIECPPDLVEDGPCSEQEGPVTNFGCCTPTGDLYYCEIVRSNTIVKQSCGQ